MQEMQETQFQSLGGGGKWQPTSVFLSGKFHGQRSLVSPWDSEELDMTEWLNRHAQTITEEKENVGYI